jgi:hypothetical protein
MISSKFIAVVAVYAGLLDVACGETTGRVLRRQNDNTPSTCLAEKAIQTASFSDGQGQNEDGVKAGQSPSEKSVLPSTQFGISLIFGQEPNQFY